MRKFLGAKGLSLVEGIMGAGLLGAAALGFAELSKNSSTSTQLLEARYTKMDVEQSIRSAFVSADSCKCVFAGKNISAGTNLDLSGIIFTDASCGNPRTIITSGQNVANSTLKVESISVRNISTYGASEVIGDLVVNWKNPGKGLPLKPSLMRNLRFSVGAGGVVNGCGFVPEQTTPEECGNGTICLAGKQIQFFNDPAWSAPLSAISQGVDSEGWLAVALQAPSGRIALLKFKDISGTLRYKTPHQNWAPQLCWYHFLTPTHTFPDIGRNCGSAIHWHYYNGSGSSPQIGNTGNASLRVNHSGQKPFTP